MIYLLLFWEFFKIGLLAVGGGLVTVPFLFDLTEEYSWFDKRELIDMIAIAQSTPGPVGINMATYAGFNAAGIGGALLATLSEVLPAVIIVYYIAKMLKRWQDSPYVEKVLKSIRPAVIALILFAGLDVAKETVVDWQTAAVLVVLCAAMRLYKKSPFFYIAASAVIGLILKI
ncbi:MAG: chromate transporter [Alphaproteobacteria bacterium]|nr:chromate transporter [Alphaproteobacteria bacterium]